MEEEVWMMAGVGNGGWTALKLLKQENKAQDSPRKLALLMFAQMTY